MAGLKIGVPGCVAHTSTVAFMSSVFPFPGFVSATTVRVSSLGVCMNLSGGTGGRSAALLDPVLRTCRFENVVESAHRYQ